MNFKKALCWSFAIHLFIVIMLFILFPLRPEDYTNFTIVNLIDIPSYAADINATPKKTADTDATREKTIIQPFSIPNNLKVQPNKTLLQPIPQIDKTSTNHLKPPSLPEQTKKILPDNEPRLKFMAPVNYYAQNGGSLTFKILVSEEGEPLQIELDQGSSNSRLDRAIKEALKQSEYIPAIVDGVPSQGWFTFSYRHWNISNETPPSP